MLSSEIQERLKQAAEEQNNYQPNEEICQKLGEKSLIMLVGPAAVGKTRVIQAAANLDPDFAPVSVFTTRAKRPDDNPDLFHYYEHSDEGVGELLNRIEHREVINYAIHPASGNIYGTGPEDYPGEYNLLATLSNGVDQLRSLPFKSKTVIGLTTDPDTWTEWFDARPMPDRSTREKSLFEAAMSLDWLLHSGVPGLTFVSNIKGHPEWAARQVIAAAKNELPPFDEEAQRQARGMRRRAIEMLEKTAL